MANNEEWRPVVGWESLYEVSSLGRVRSLPREFVRSDGVRHARPDRVLNVGPRANQTYPAVSLAADRSVVTRRVHTLVAEAFHGPRPEGNVVRHLDGNPTNNTVQNLAYGTQRENVHDALAYDPEAPISRPCCKYGHLLSGANLWVRNRRNGWRERHCIACMKARRWAREERLRGGSPTLEDRTAKADQLYAEAQCDAFAMEEEQ